MYSNHVDCGIENRRRQMIWYSIGEAEKLGKPTYFVKSYIVPSLSEKPWRREDIVHCTSTIFFTLYRFQIKTVIMIEKTI